jgi:formamidopyrimidine-DNA glycosylase
LNYFIFLKTDVLLFDCRILPENVAKNLSHPETKERVLSCSDASDVLRYAFTLTEAAIDHQYEVHPFSRYLSLLFDCRILPENVAKFLSHPETKERVLSCSDASDVLRYAFTLTEVAIDHQYEVHPFSRYLSDIIVELCFGLNPFAFLSNDFY